MRAQFASGTLTDLQRVNLLEELLQAHERAVEKRKAEARESLMKDAQKLRAERTAARKEKLKQEKHLVAQLEEQLQAETKEIKEKKEQARRRGLAFWMKTICLIFVSLLLLLVAVLGSAVLYAQHYDQELLYRLLLRVLPQAMYASPAYFASRSLRVVCDGLLPI